MIDEVAVNAVDFFALRDVSVERLGRKGDQVRGPLDDVTRAAKEYQAEQSLGDKPAHHHRLLMMDSIAANLQHGKPRETSSATA